MVVVAPIGDFVSGQVRRFLEATGGDPAKLVMTGPRITLILASVIVLAAAVYASRAIPWRRSRSVEHAIPDAADAIPGSADAIPDTDATPEEAPRA
jgi:hypothetical protein